MSKINKNTQRKLILIPILLFTIMIISFAIIFIYSLSPVDSKNESVIPFTVEKGWGKNKIITELKKADLIRSEFFSKVIIKLKNKELYAGTYKLSKELSTNEILEKISNQDNIENEGITITFVEGKRLTTYVSQIANNFEFTEEAILEKMSNKDYLNTLINKYWFLTEDILNENIYYPLEGYLFPDTYEFMNKNVSIENIFETLLNQMDKKLTPLRSNIEENNYSIHQIITLASMVQSEGNNIDDFKKMSSIFLTRLKKKMKLQSCASAYYGDKKIMGRDEFGTSYLKKNSYNTYSVSGLPIGPISNPGIDAIESVLNPSETEYLYFASDKNMNIYYSKTLKEHENTIAQLKKAGNWYGS